MPDIKPQIFSLQNDPLNYKSFFPACKMTYTPFFITFAPKLNQLWQKTSY